MNDSHPLYPDLNSKIALIMGIGQTPSSNPNSWGNGAAIALRLSQNGCSIFGCDLDLTAAERTKSRLPPGSRCEVMRADVTSSHDVSNVVDTCIATFGRIDILVNNVGFPAHGDVTSMMEDVWDEQIRVNLRSVYLACHFVVPIMRRQDSGGSVVNNASVAGMRYLGKSQVAYNAAKAAVINFTKVTAAEFASCGVRLNCVVPGLIMTPLVEDLERSEDEGKRKMFRQIMQHNVPMGRLGSPFDVADATVFLSSSAAKYITGHSLVVDGGLVVSTGP
ncbi:hypothetical protein AC579_1459 [Pseudocercospora musae]|uniref:Uncharacterized protein n=1 Tax=Pseudocercospora musae TaxID=113226 RepID=A0A139IMP6_9PEZI|nr:hypothetical protein AC579_1459 [Pseudocercospora musae]